jgi:hypothetical protein
MLESAENAQDQEVKTQEAEHESIRTVMQALADLLEREEKRSAARN